MRQVSECHDAGVEPVFVEGGAVVFEVDHEAIGDAGEASADGAAFGGDGGVQGLDLN